eukprot:Skav220460  [mRNA]  locus=scaffold4165:64092:66235:+ [translate_table: standard]
MFAAMSLLMLLVPALEGTSATGEPQHSDPSCLLQKKVADQAMTQIDPVEPPLICEDCQCLTDAEPSNPVFPIGGFDECLDHCFGLPGFTYRELASGDAVCWCCNDLDTEDIEIDKLIDKFGLGETTFQAVYSTDLAEEEGDGGGPAGDPEAGCGPEDPVENICPSGTMCGCLSNPGPPGPPLENAAFSDCKDLCVGFPGFVIRELPDFSDASGGTKTQCWCCDSTDLENIPENGYWVNYEVYASARADNRFVDGELKTGRRDFSDFSKLSMMQTSTLGGSEQAALYLEDQAQAAPMSLLSTPCTSEKENAAKATCSKHLGDMEKDQTLFQDCVFDLCHGADETVAELAAELRDSTRAI